jgi:hypothetical protein
MIVDVTVERSPEVCDLIREMFASADADDGEAMIHLHSVNPFLTFVGVRPDDVWVGYDAVAAAHRDGHTGEQAGELLQHSSDGWGTYGLAEGPKWLPEVISGAVIWTAG